RENRFWVGVVLFTLASLSSIAVGRAWVGTEAAFAPRYTTFSLILLAALYALLANLVRGNPSRLPRFVLSGLLIVIVLSLPIALYRGWSFGEQQHEKESKQAWVLRNAATLPDAELIIVHPIPQVVRRGAQILQRFRCSVFRDSPQPEKSY
ncbi:MAG TPA: hypothetical protein VK469_16320, partial [Candidatus Kapabacteria bacterium]|nr:hypothetical protein [Candidatus Kapabacteria bacterium]